MKKKFLLSFFIVLTIILTALSVGAADTEAVLVSPGLEVIAAESGMARSGIRGRELSFERDDFARALNLSKLTSVTFTSVPPKDEGELRVGTTVISEGQTISGSNISLISFVPEKNVSGETSFTFSPNGAAYDIACTIYMLDEMNYAPTLNLASSLSLNVSTYQNVTHFGKLSAYDPDGDDCIFEIVSYPERGILVLEDSSTGEYRYTPVSDFAGKDSFSYVAKDKYGNYSASAEVSLTVSRSSLSVSFADMEDSTAHTAAIALTEDGIMSGTQLGSGYYFQPELTVSRAEFVVMAMKALGVDGVSNAKKTVFADDADILGEMKGYISAAYELGYVKGSKVDGKLCFLPNETITRAEAAVIVGRMIDAATPTVKPSFSDSEDIPAWAESSVYSLASLGILDTDGGEVRAADKMTRADTAKMLDMLGAYQSLS